MTCPSCSVSVPEGARFCPSCGHALLSPSDERRIVTVLFGDLVGFTALSENRDPEQVKNLVDHCFERLAADITSYGGRVDKIVGDAVVALFGAPVAHEDDAERAVRAGLAMQKTLAEQASFLRAPVEMRVGINTGEVLVGALRTGGDYTAMGDVVNTASRLQTMAEPGQVIVGAETHGATRDVFRYMPLGSLEARGRDQHVEAWVAEEALTAPGRRPRRSTTPLVGRAAEVDLLRAAFSNAFSTRRPHLALVLGEAGIGKSRLSEAVVFDVARDHGAGILLGRSLPYGEANVWWPVAEAMRAACAIEPSDDATVARDKALSAVSSALRCAPEEPEAVRTVEALLWLMGEEGGLGDVDPGRARDEVSRAVRTFLEGLAAQHPLVFILSDVQWADQLVLDLIDHLLERLHRLPLVILLTARPELEERWRPTPGRHNLVVLNLDPLGAAAAAQLLEALLGSAPTDELAANLVERSGGNPFFLEELAALLTESGALADDADLPQLPATLRGLVAARLDALSGVERSVLEDAAVLGRRGPVAALEALSAGRGQGPVGGALVDLVARELLVVEEGQCEFGSDIVREVAYGTLTKAERARRHAALAGWLDGQAAEKERADEFLEELARHYAAAAELAEEVGTVDGVPPDIIRRALDALQRAAERAEDRELHLMSERLFDQQLRIIGSTPAPERRHALIGRARARTALRQDELSLADLVDALEEAAEAGDDVAVARALTVRGDIERNAGLFDESLATLDRAAHLWREVGDRRGEAAALRRLGMTNLFAGETDLAEESLREALSAFQEIGARKGIAWVNQNLAWIAFTRGDTTEADVRLDDAVAMFTDIGDFGGRGWALGLRGWVRYGQGRATEAEALALQVREEAREQGDPWALGMMMVLLASVRLWQGRAAEAVEQSSAARELFEGISDRWGLARAVGPLSRGLLVTGRVEEAYRVIEELAAPVPGLRPTLEEQRFPAVLTAELAVHLGDGERALKVLADVGLPGRVEGFGAADIGIGQGVAMAQTGRTADAVATLARVVPLHEDVGPLANALCSLALARAADGDADGARRDAEATLALEGGTYLDRVLALLALALAAARQGDGAAASEALRQADEILEGTDDVLTRAIAALARARVLVALGDGTAKSVLDDARERFDCIGVDGRGWDELFRAATGAAEPVTGGRGS
ncbi:MAG TPA: adenylate/guanylate cyclase domain-containing protein [Acidimicrobiales bacterium]|nr:adenylate/guanylate cyclase domain-containing protein [Acidimicrobiales bacterium]